MLTKALKIEPLGAVMGARITGLDLSRPIDQGAVDDVLEALAKHQFIVLPDQHISPEQQRDFGAAMGTLNVHPHMESLEGFPEVLNIAKEADDTLNFGGGWHTDLTFLEEPPLGSVLYARDIPARGGDTLFAHMGAAYDALSAGLKNMLEGLVAVHTARNIYGEKGVYSSSDHPAKNRDVEEASNTCEHPVIRTHPVSGQKLIFVNPAFTYNFKGMTRAESKPLLNYLCEFATQPQFVYRHCWQVNDVAMWDNRSTQHYALNDYQGSRRVMHRVTVDGDKPF